MGNKPYELIATYKIQLGKQYGAYEFGIYVSGRGEIGWGPENGNDILHPIYRQGDISKIVRTNNVEYQDVEGLIREIVNFVIVKAKISASLEDILELNAKLGNRVFGDIKSKSLKKFKLGI